MSLHKERNRFLINTSNRKAKRNVLESTLECLSFFKVISWYIWILGWIPGRGGGKSNLPVPSKTYSSEKVFCPMIMKISIFRALTCFNILRNMLHSKLGLVRTIYYPIQKFEGHGVELPTSFIRPRAKSVRKWWKETKNELFLKNKMIDLYLIKCFLLNLMAVLKIYGILTK